MAASVQAKMQTPRSRPWERAVGIASLGAGGIHGSLTLGHFAQWWGYGLFFLGAAAAQVLFGLALLLDAINPRDTGPRAETWKRRLFWAGILGNAAIIGLYVVTRTTGIPFFGPAVGDVEPVGTVDIVSKALEAAVIAGCAFLLWAPGIGRPRATREPAS